MEQQVLRACENTLWPSPNLTEKSLYPQTLASLRSLIINPSTPESTISSIFETLSRSLQLSRDPLVLHHTLKLLSDLSSHHTSLSYRVFDSVVSHSVLFTESTRLAAESLDVLASIAERYPTLASAMDELDDRLFLSPCFAPSVSVRPWLLRNAERFRISPCLLFTAFLGFTKDPYPYVRKFSLDGLVGLSKSDVIESHSMIEGCYCRAVELLRDMEDCVRAAAVRAVSAWGLMLAASNPETKPYWSDDLFVKLCSMGRDMSVEVRVEVFDALGKIEMVSEDILLQTLFKRVQGTTKEKRSFGQCDAEQFEISALSTAGVLVHGLEDEFYEVRKSACHSLRTLTIISAEFASEAVNYLMDVLNDDSMIVRLQALETMLHMATCDCLKVQKTHMHMFLGTLIDSSTFIRSAARKILKLVKLPNMHMFELSFNGLVRNLEKHPQDEADVLSVLFHIGCNHGRFVDSIVNMYSAEIVPASDGKLGFDSIRVAGLLVLAISAPLSHEQHVSSIPPTIFSYAVTWLRRISLALTDVMNQNAVLAYLSQCSRSTISSATEFNLSEGEPVVKIDTPNYTSNETIGSIGTPLQQKRDEASKIQSWILREPREVASSLADQLEVHDKVMESMNLILAKVKDIWPLIKSGLTNEVLRTLRSFKEELATFTSDSLGSVGALAFTLQYLRVTKLLVKVWEHFLAAKEISSFGMGELDLVLGKLDMRLRELRSRFTGLSLEQELQILELKLLTCTFRLCKVEICCHLAILKKLSTTISHVESILKLGSLEPSSFVVEIGKLLCVIGTSSNGVSCTPFRFRKLLEIFSLKQFVLCGRLKHIKAELDVPNNDTENPLPFVSRLPVGIPCEITLHNISSEDKLWLRMTIDSESTQFFFLDLNLSDGCEEVRRFTFVAPFYRTPKAISFTLRVCIGMECLFEDVHFVKSYGGPKRELTYLCQEKEVHLSMVGID